MSDQPVAQAATYTARNKHKRGTSRTSWGFEPAITGIERPQTYALYRATIEIDLWCTLPASEVNCAGQDTNMAVIVPNSLINPQTKTVRTVRNVMLFL